MEERFRWNEKLISGMMKNSEQILYPWGGARVPMKSEIVEDPDICKKKLRRIRKFLNRHGLDMWKMHEMVVET